MQVNIQNPCAQPWNQMQPNDHGRFCAHCQQTVIDFSCMTDAQIIAFLAQPKGKMCGQFRADQLNRKLVDTRAKSPHIHAFAPLLAAASLVTASEAVSLQGAPRAVVSDIAPGSSSSSDLGQTRRDSVPPASPVMLTVTGSVKDIDGNQLIGASVRLIGTQRGTVTDIDGNFSLPIPSDSVEQSLNLTLTYTGYAPLEVCVLRDAPQVQFVMHEDEALLGEVVVVGGFGTRYYKGAMVSSYTIKLTAWQRVKRFVRHRVLRRD